MPSEAGRPPDAPTRPPGQARTALRDHDGFGPWAAGGRERAGPAVRGRQAERALGGRPHAHLDARGVALARRGARAPQPPRRRDATDAAPLARHRRLGDGAGGSRPDCRSALPQRPRQPVCQQRLSGVAKASRLHVLGWSRRGNCSRNAPVESFFAPLKRELVHGERFETRSAARRSLFEVIEGWYNRERLHSWLGYVSPATFERVASEKRAAGHRLSLLAVA